MNKLKKLKEMYEEMTEKRNKVIAGNDFSLLLNLRDLYDERDCFYDEIKKQYNWNENIEEEKLNQEDKESLHIFYKNRIETLQEEIEDLKAMKYEK